MRVLIALLALLPACSFAIAGDSVANCERLSDAKRALGIRCGVIPEPLDCSALWSDMTESRVNACIEEMNNLGCGADLDEKCGFTSFRID
jgi:hypothetical protein